MFLYMEERREKEKGLHLRAAWTPVNDAVGIKRAHVVRVSRVIRLANAA